MQTIVIERCTLRIVRRGGWSWGPNPRGLLEAAVQALPWLLARELATGVAEQSRAELDSPVSLSVRVRAEDIIAAASTLSTGDTDALGRSPLVHALAQALLTHPDLRPRVDHPPASTVAKAPVSGPDQDGVDGMARENRLLQFLTRQHELGQLGAVLGRISPELLATWSSWLLKEGTPYSETGVQARRTLIAPLVTTTPKPQTDVPPPSRADVHRRRIVLAVRCATELGLEPWRADLAETLRRILPLPSAAAVAAASIAAPLASPRPALPPAIERPPSRRPGALLDFDQVSALPFLLLGPLHQLGYFETLSLAMPEAVAPTFAAALAAKVLPPPVRGWMCDARSAATVAAFAGVDRHVPDAAFTGLAAVAAPALSALDDVIVRELLGGHTAGSPLCVLAAGEERLLVDADGAFVLGAAESNEMIAGLLRGVHAWVVVLGGAASPPLMKALSDAGAAFITDAPPRPHERWTRVTGTNTRCWTSTPVPPPTRLLHRIEEIRGIGERAAELWTALSARPAVPRSAARQLERSLALAAAEALGAIAWTLWRDREATDPLLSLERFTTLDARIRFDGNSIRVRLPLGMRHLDLQRHGLLADVSGLPWLGGRTVVFSGG